MKPELRVARATFRVLGRRSVKGTTMLTGRYYHNVANTWSTTPTHAAQLLNSSGARGHLDLGGQVYPFTFAERLRKERRYETGLFGKCMNEGCGAQRDTGGAVSYTHLTLPTKA